MGESGRLELIECGFLYEIPLFLFFRTVLFGTRQVEDEICRKESSGRFVKDEEIYVTSTGKKTIIHLQVSLFFFVFSLLVEIIFEFFCNLGKCNEEYLNKIDRLIKITSSSKPYSFFSLPSSPNIPGCI